MTSQNAGAALARDRLVVSVRRWFIALVATALSTYTLDAFATTTGVLLAASHLLQGLDFRILGCFLAITYGAWWLAMRENLAANWALLQDTGTSTNVLSKVAHDSTALWTQSARARRFAASVGYVGTELVKETPYYAGAFGAALVSDAVSAGEALIFLGGANLGAAAYEFALARGTSAYLERRTHSGYAAFETDWRPAAYLTEYYASVEPDEQRTIAFFIEALRKAKSGEPVLFFGVGPTLHHVFAAAPIAAEIHLTDYLPGNLAEIERWMENRAGAHDWRPFVRYTLQCEGFDEPSEAQISARETLTRSKITKLFKVDLREADPLGGQGENAYGTVISAYCADSATGDQATWRRYMRCIASLARPGGLLITSALAGSRGYVVGGKLFPSPNLSEHDMRAVLETCVNPATLAIEAHRLEQQRHHGYAGVLLASGWRTDDMATRIVQ